MFKKREEKKIVAKGKQRREKKGKMCRREPNEKLINQ